MKRSLLPTVLVILGLTLLIGCLYIPTFEQPASQAQRDFRDLVGDDPGRPIRPGYVNRRTVILLLGQPDLESVDHKSIGYLFATHQGYWFWPLCFTGQEATRREYGLRLDFRDDGVLREFRVANDQEYSDSLFAEPLYPANSVIQQLNASEPTLRERSWLELNFPEHFPKRNVSTKPDALP
jgi:hypothetical protein